MSISLGTLTLKTCKILDEDPLPHFESYYPYTGLNDFDVKLEPVKYEVVILENEYLRIAVIPTLGARIYDVFDKVNNAHIFHYNKTIRPAMMALRGAWISSGIEFNLLHTAHHTPDNFSPVDWKGEQKEDGISVIYLSNLNLITDIFWLVEVILRPGKQFLELNIKNFNNSPLPSKYYFWTNTAESVTEKTRIFIPGRRTLLGKFPLDKGVDLSWYKNHNWSDDSFIIDSEEDFFGCYDYSFNRGVVQYANHFKVAGKKMFTWGTSGDGLFWVPVFSDDGFPYIELQSGRFRTQGIVEFIEPHFLDQWEEIWYPIAKIGGISFANKDATIYLDVKYNKNKKEYAVFCGIYTTKKFSNSKIEVFLGSDVVNEQVDLSPEKPYVKTFVSRDKKVGVKLFDNDGKEIISWDIDRDYKTEIDLSVKYSSPVDLADDYRWKKLKTPEEIWLDGIKEEKIGKSYVAELKYKFALKVDKEFSNACTSLGILYLRQGRYSDAKTFLEKTVKRNLWRGDSHYYLGLCYFHLGDYFKAEIEFWKARNYPNFFSPSSYYLSILNIKKRNVEMAEKILAECIKKCSDDIKIFTLYAAILRIQERAEEAIEFVEKALKIFPLYYTALFERLLCVKGTDKFDDANSEFKRIVLASDEKVLEVAKDYLNYGLFEDAKELLEMKVSDGKSSPLIHYYLGFVYEKLGNTRKREEQYKIGSSKSCDYVFPHRVEEIEILQSVKAENNSPNPSYYLGNLYFYLGRFNDAVNEWELARKNKLRHPVLLRNLGYAYYRLQRREEAVEMYRQAKDLIDTVDYRLFLESYNVSKTFGVTEEMIKTLEEVANKFKKSSLWAVLADAFVEVGEYEKALGILKTHQFVPTEGYYGYWDIFVEANVRKGVDLLKADKYDEALEHFQEALTYPSNLGVGAPYISRRHEAMQKFWLGECLWLKGDKNSAIEMWKSISTQETFSPYEIYYKGQVLRKLGRVEEADILFESLLNRNSTQEKVLLNLKRRIPKEVFFLSGYDQRLALCYCGKMIAYYGIGKKREGSKEFRKAFAITKDLGHYKWLYNVGFSFLGNN